MDDSTIDVIQYLYNENKLTSDSLEQCKQWLEKKYSITEEKELYNFEIELAPALYDFKTEILDNLLILLSQLTDIEEIKRVYDKLEDIQAILAYEFEEENY